jgi:hypothetical protein
MTSVVFSTAPSGHSHNGLPQFVSTIVAEGRTSMGDNDARQSDFHWHKSVVLQDL